MRPKKPQRFESAAKRVSWRWRVATTTTMATTAIKSEAKVGPTNFTSGLRCTQKLDENGFDRIQTPYCLERIGHFLAFTNIDNLQAEGEYTEDYFVRAYISSLARSSVHQPYSTHNFQTNRHSWTLALFDGHTANGSDHYFIHHSEAGS